MSLAKILITSNTSSFALLFMMFFAERKLNGNFFFNMSIYTPRTRLSCDFTPQRNNDQDLLSELVQTCQCKDVQSVMENVTPDYELKQEELLAFCLNTFGPRLRGSSSGLWSLRHHGDQAPNISPAQFDQTPPTFALQERTSLGGELTAVETSWWRDDQFPFNLCLPVCPLAWPLAYPLLYPLLLCDEPNCLASSDDCCICACSDTADNSLLVRESMR